MFEPQFSEWDFISLLGDNVFVLKGSQCNQSFPWDMKRKLNKFYQQQQQLFFNRGPFTVLFIMITVQHYRAQGAALKLWEQIFHNWEICVGLTQPDSLNHWVLGTVRRDHHCATWDGNNTNLLQRQRACHKSFKSSFSQPECQREKPLGCTLISPGRSLLIRTSEANEENIVIQGAGMAVWHVN